MCLAPKVNRCSSFYFQKSCGCCLYCWICLRVNTGSDKKKRTKDISKRAHRVAPRTILTETNDGVDGVESDEGEVDNDNSDSDDNNSDSGDDSNSDGEDNENDG